MRDGELTSPEDRAIGLRLSQARAAAHLSQRDVAEALGVDQSRIAKLETGTRRLLFSEAISFAHLYGTTLEELVPRSRPGSDNAARVPAP